MLYLIMQQRITTMQLEEKETYRTQQKVGQKAKQPERMPKAQALALADRFKKSLMVASVLGFGVFSGLAAYHQIATTTTTTAATSTSSGSSQATSTTTTSPSTTSQNNSSSTSSNSDSSSSSNSSSDNSGFLQQGGNNVSSSNSSQGSSSSSPAVAGSHTS
jgi:hypothetical protein